LAGWIKKAMKLTHGDGKPGWYEKLYSIAMRESRGDPRAINNYDINAKNGIPSKGVMQIIPPMYKKFHQAGTSWNMYDPISNIAAAINYIKGVYGSPQNTPANYYDNGGWLQPGKAAINATNKPELALNESQGRALERRISGYDQPMHVTVNTPAVAMDEGQFTAVMTRVVNQNRGIRPN
jgi:SLT domain-containing protein